MRVYTVAGIAGLAAGAVLAARRGLLVIEVVGDSMDPTYHSGDRLLVRRSRRVRRGHVVIAHHQEGGRREEPGAAYVTTWLVKRLVALPGDPVPDAVKPAVGGNGHLVPAGMTVLLGDHPGSADSRSWGFIPLSDVAGIVVARLRPRPLRPGLA
ncbi:S26 family signal peptidase [Actinoplanes sp. NEAU-A12]|uniref:S26 family signal peptidase n=1 Tax=Actinoplanes sandaracinus TaxID=3045177 RepID=A0ABT6WCI3_9ACTN|nr:S26 family signal peptidase [Actinoplanes sandaracinus]MDI6097446.1 S26 family signal peptidase [Actinoplanes sandaracinus]